MGEKVLRRQLHFFFTFLISETSSAHNPGNTKMTGKRVSKVLRMQLTNVSIGTGCQNDSAGELCLDVMPPWSAQCDDRTRSEADG